MKYSGKTWKFGDHVDTDVIIPARYLTTSDPKELGRHCLEDADPDFVKKIRKRGHYCSREKFRQRFFQGTCPDSH